MTPGRLLLASLRHYRRSHLAVVVGVATSVAALAGALLVGESVRASLRALALERLGRADLALLAPGFVRETLGDDLREQAVFRDSFEDLAPLVVVDAAVAHESSGRRAGSVSLFGVDARFWRLHGQQDPELRGRRALSSPALADELGYEAGDTLLVRVRRAGDVPGSSLFGRRDASGRTLRLRAEGVRPVAQLGEFSLRPNQQAQRALFVPLEQLQRALDESGRVNAFLLAAGDAVSPARAGELFREALRGAWSLEDVGIGVRALEERGALSLESRTAMLDDATVAVGRAAARAVGGESAGVLTYLANTIRAGSRTIPYSLVSGLEPAQLRELAGGEAGGPHPIVLNRWAAEDLQVGGGDEVLLDYFVWEEEGRLRTERAAFEVAAVTELRGIAADPELAPEYPGITESESLSDWDPPFPIDLGRVRDEDEEYWREHRTTPKAFVSLADAQSLWRHRQGRLTSLRIYPGEGAGHDDLARSFAAELRERLDPFGQGFSLEELRAQALAASRGTTDFGQYFGYFSFFVIAAALLLAALFFRLGAEQRLVELGTLSALGFSAGDLRRTVLAEGGALAALGGLLGAVGAWLYAELMLLGLRTIWVDAVGTERLRVALTPGALLGGASAGVLCALLSLALTVRGLLRIAPRRLLAGALDRPGAARAGAAARRLAGGSALLALALLIAAAGGMLPAVAGFFGAGAALMAAALSTQWLWLSGRPRRDARDVFRLGLRNAGHRPGRSLLAIALIAFATFVIVSVGAFRHDEQALPTNPEAPNGGFALYAESLLEIHHDPNTPEGRSELGIELPELEGVSLAPFRLRPGDDASCLNLYRPSDPRVLAPRDEFLRQGRFSFAASLAETAEERANPWLLLGRKLEDGAIPVIGDQNSLSYVLHLGLGEELRLPRDDGSELRLRLVAALETGLFQGELLMSEAHFLRAFPERDGYRFFLVDAPSERRDRVTAALESRLEDYGLDVRTTTSRLQGFHRVENTYLSTFQALGALGLLLGTLGLAAVLMRNALERRRELALLRAVGYTRRDLGRMVLAENLLLLVLGLGTGTLCALLAVAPAALERAASFPYGSLAALLAIVAGTGVAASRLATAAIVRSPLIPALRSE
jgi:hypothetical protein